MMWRERASTALHQVTLWHHPPGISRSVMTVVNVLCDYASWLEKDFRISGSAMKIIDFIGSAVLECMREKAGR